MAYQPIKEEYDSFEFHITKTELDVKMKYIPHSKILLGGVS